MNCEMMDKAQTFVGRLTVTYSGYKNRIDFLNHFININLSLNYHKNQ